MSETHIQRSRPGAGNGGFTVIELMAVIAIVSILAVIATTAYQDYVVRSQVSEGLNFAAEAKTSVSEYYYNNNYVMPANNQQAGLQPASAYGAFKFVASLGITSVPRPGTIEITFDIPALGTNRLLQLIPSTARADKTISWTCIPPTTDGVAANRVPANCRG